MLVTVTPVSRHWFCQSGESTLRAQNNGDVQAETRLRPVNSMQLDSEKKILLDVPEALFEVVLGLYWCQQLP